MSQSVRKILIIRYSSMGDVILVAPVVAVVRKRNPDAEIVLLTQNAYVHLFKDDSRLTRVVGVRRGEFADELASYGEWDLVIDLQHNNRSRKQIALLQVQQVTQFNKMHTERTILLLLRRNIYGSNCSVAMRYLQASGERPPYGVLDFGIPFDRAPARRLLPLLRYGDIDRPVIALFPFSAWKNKEWPAEYFISIGHFFLIKGWNVILLGGKTDRDQAEAMREKIGYRCVSFAGELDLRECGSLLMHCRLALGCDSGLSHLARACGIKCGIIFGPTTRHFGFQPVNDPECRIFEVKRFCRPCHPHGGNICLHLDHGCMTKITPEVVISGLMELYHG